MVLVSSSLCIPSTIFDNWFIQDKWSSHQENWCWQWDGDDGDNTMISSASLSSLLSPLSCCSRHIQKGKSWTGKQMPINSFDQKLEHNQCSQDIHQWQFLSLERRMATKTTRLLLFTISIHPLCW
jgi:hypothetical protein